MDSKKTYAKAKVWPIPKIGTKFHDCDCKVVDTDKDSVIVELCKTHTDMIKNGSMKYFYNFCGPAIGEPKLTEFGSEIK